MIDPDTLDVYDPSNLCSTCGGGGLVAVPVPPDDYDWTRCPTCDGTGHA